MKCYICESEVQIVSNVVCPNCKHDRQPMNEPQDIESQIVSHSALEAIERAQVDLQISTAKRFPRTLSKVKSDMLSFATLDEETASSCFYTLPRGGKTIQGPSVRLAEIAIACYGNLKAGSRIIETVSNGENPHVVIQAVCHDLERNVSISIEKRRRIVGKKSKGGAIDEDDINLAANAGSAIAFRDAVFKIVPLALIKPIYEAAKKVAVGDIKSLDKKRGQVLDRLKQMGAKEERILAVVGCRKVEDIGAEQLEVLIGLGTALKDGDTTLEEAFPNAIPQGKVGANPLEETQPAKERRDEPSSNEAQSLSPTAPSTSPVQSNAAAESDPPPAAKRTKTEDELLAKLSKRLSAAGVQKTMLIQTLVDSGVLADPVPFNELSYAVLVLVDEQWEKIKESLKS